MQGGYTATPPLNSNNDATTLLSTNNNRLVTTYGAQQMGPSTTGDARASHNSRWGLNRDIIGRNLFSLFTMMYDKAAIMIPVATTPIIIVVISGLTPMRILENTWGVLCPWT
jgi:hypothetical protein